MSTIWHLALKELRDGLRNRWVAVSILALGALACALALLGSAPGGVVKASALSVTVVSLSSLTVYLLPLIAVMLSYDAVVGEAERGTLQLLLSYPVARWQVLVGKFVGHLAILALAVAVGFGMAAAAIALQGGADAAGWRAYLALCGSAVLLGAVFIGLGYLLSTLCDERAKAAGLALVLWFLLVVVYDLGLLGLLLADAQQTLPKSLFTGLLLANPTDAFRIFNMTFLEDVRVAAGLGGLGAEAVPGAAAPIGVLAIWALAAVAAATALFHRKEV